MERAKQLMEMVTKYESLIYDTADYIWKTPETGYREWKTSAYMEEHFEALGYTLTKAGNIPGFYADLDTGRPGPKIAILGELDSLIVGNHPDADPETHAVHACGHNAQCAILLGVAAAMKEPGALDGLCGSIRFMAVPAEELIELGFREELRKQGVIRYFGGKVEFISRGYFDGVDMAMMIHSGKLPEGKTLSVSQGCNGCITKNITFKGVASHAGGSPEAGKNALYAATCGLNAVNAIRETFVDSEHIRFHPIITEGGAAVNALPATATVDDHPGYFPLNNDANMTEILTEAMEAVTGPGTVTRGSWGTGCTDMGDVSAIMPAIHPHASGSIGTGHGKDYYVADKKAGCLYPAQCLTVAASMFLENDAARAKKVLAEAKPYFKSKEEYLAAIDNLTMDKDAVIYNEDGTVTLDFCQR